MQKKFLLRFITSAVAAALVVSAAVIPVNAASTSCGIPQSLLDCIKNSKSCNTVNVSNSCNNAVNDENIVNSINEAVEKYRSMFTSGNCGYSNSAVNPSQNTKSSCNTANTKSYSKPKTKTNTKQNTNTNTNTNTTAANTNTSTSTPAVSPSEYVNEVLRLVNSERAKEGLSALTLNNTLCKAADVRAAEIVKSFSHTRPNGTSCFTAVKEAGYTNYRSLGENIAAGQKTPVAVVTAWMNSPGHRANIMSKNFTTIGIGYLNTSSGYGHYWTQMFAG